MPNHYLQNYETSKNTLFQNNTKYGQLTKKIYIKRYGSQYITFYEID